MNTDIVRTLKNRSVSCLKKCSSRVRPGAVGGGGEGGGGRCARGRACCGAGGGGGGRNAERLLPHISCVLALFGGAALLTCARLKWDPSAYVALREVFPGEYRAVCVALPLACAAAVLLNHVAIGALLTVDLARRRILLFVYAALTMALLVSEAGFVAWLAARMARWLRSAEARRVLTALDFKDYFVGPALAFLGRFIPVSRKAKALMDEAEADAPYNLYVAIGAGAVLALMQLLATALALLAAPPAPTAPCACRHVEQRYHNGGSYKGSSAYIDMTSLGGARIRRLPPPPLPPPASLAPVL